jgi:hypothetical protein
MSKFRWENGKRFPRNAGEEETTQRVILELDVELFRELEAYCTDRGTTIEEEIIAWVEAGLPDDPDTSNGDAGREKLEQKKQADDGSQPAKTGESDDDNFSSTKRRAAQLTPMTILERAQLNDQQQFLITAGRISEAGQIRKLMDAHDAAVQTQNAPALTEARAKLVAAITAAGPEHFGSRR